MTVRSRRSEAWTLRTAETARGALTERGHGADDGHENQGEHDRVFDGGRGGRVSEKLPYAGQTSLLVVGPYCRKGLLCEDPGDDLRVSGRLSTRLFRGKL